MNDAHAQQTSIQQKVSTLQIQINTLQRENQQLPTNSATLLADLTEIPTSPHYPDSTVRLRCSPPTPTRPCRWPP